MYVIPDDAVDRRKLGKLNYRSIPVLTRFTRPSFLFFLIKIPYDIQRRKRKRMERI